MSDLTTIPNDFEGVGELRQTEPPRILSNSSHDALLALLDADEEPNEALKAAAADYKKGHRDGEVYRFQTPCPKAGDAPR